MNFHYRPLGKSNFLEYMEAYIKMCKTFRKDGNKLGKRKRELLMAEIRDTKAHDDLINSFYIIDDPIIKSKCTCSSSFQSGFCQWCADQYERAGQLNPTT